MDGLPEHIALNSIRELVSKSAPLIGAVLGSPLASIGISLLSNFFGVDSQDTQEILNKINSTPDIDSKLKEIEYQHRQVLLQIASDNYKTEVDDRKSAREREISLHDKVPTILSIGFLIVYSFIQFYVIYNPGSDDDIISARLQDILVMIVSYYFGSSHKDKPLL
jgi:hypothetical protein